MNTISKVKTIELMKNNKLFECEFIKKDNTLRKMKCAYENDKSNSNYIIVYDLEKEDYRNVNLMTLTSLTIQDTTYQVV